MATDRTERIVEALRGAIADLSDGALAPGDLDPTAPLFDAGYVDSLSAVVLIERIRTRWGVAVSEVDLVGRLHTLRALGTFIATHARDGT